jgi:hypothetical protein
VLLWRHGFQAALAADLAGGRSVLFPRSLAGLFEFSTSFPALAVRFLEFVKDETKRTSD